MIPKPTNSSALYGQAPSELISNLTKIKELNVIEEMLHQMNGQPLPVPQTITEASFTKS